MKRVPLTVLLLALIVSPVHLAVAAEIQEVVIDESPNIIFLPLTIMRHNRLLEKHAKAAGLGDIRTQWHQTTGAGMATDAVLAGKLHFAATGTGAFAKVWEKTQGTPLAALGVGAVSSIPLFLNTRNPAVKSVNDFSGKDRIGLPTVKTSHQAMVLQMAAAQAFGEQNYAKHDALTVTINHTDGMAALLSRISEINSHFTAPPYQYREIKEAGIHRVLSSYDVLGGPATGIIVWTTRQFREANPRTMAAFTAALHEAMAIVNRDKRATATMYIEATRSKFSVDDIFEIISDPQAEFSVTPKLVMKQVDFLQRTGQIKMKPATWQQLFIPEAHGLPGS